MLRLTPDAMRGIFPNAPQEILQAFVSKNDVLDRAGITASAVRLSYFFANVEHECDGFTIPHLTENINYTARRMAEVWPSRFHGADAVVAKYGSAPGWQRKAFDDIYGNRMGNRPGTHDGSTYIGRGGPQVTGRDGYENVGAIAGLDLVNRPEAASDPAMQPEICAAFWTWKRLNEPSDHGNFLECVKRWNGGTNGMADRRHRMEGNDPIIRRLQNVSTLAPQIAAIEDQTSTA